MKLLKKFLPPLLGLILLGAIIFELHKVLAKVGLSAILAAFVATPIWAVAAAVGFLLCSMAVMVCYDLPGVLFARRAHECPHLPFAKIGLASFCAYALSHVLGASAITSAAIRVRFYAYWDVPASGLARIIAISGTNFTLGVMCILGVLLLADPLAVPLPFYLTTLLLRVLGGVLLLVPLFYIAAARRFNVIDIFRRRITLPGWRVAIWQILVSCLDICLACAILYQVLPTGLGFGYPYALSLYVGAYVAGALSGLPGGVGVFDSVLLLGLSAYISADSALGAILLFRILFFLVPACLAGFCYVGHELLVYVSKSRGRAG